MEKKIIAPQVLFEKLPSNYLVQKTILGAINEIKKILTAQSEKLLVIVGPCSIHDEDSAVAYANLLKDAQKEVGENLLLVMRAYFEKPRTVMGWKGLINDPTLNESFDINEGLKLARHILLKINQLGVPVATEFLDIFIVQYLKDLISWGAIGARTVESQIHRELASGLTMPVGFKNNTNGEVRAAIEAILVAQNTHHFLSIAKDGQAVSIKTSGNNWGHLILRGGKISTNYDKRSVEQASFLLKKNKLLPSLIIDCSHGNSQRQYQRQMVVADAVVQQLFKGSPFIAGVMLEGHIKAGKQDFTTNVKPSKDCSITDACLSWEETINILRKLAKAVKERRRC